jgi:hypothetical protein
VRRLDAALALPFFRSAIGHAASFRVNDLCGERKPESGKESSVKPEHSKVRLVNA